MTRCIPRRLARLKKLVAAGSEFNQVSIRVVFVHPEEGATGIMLFETNKPTQNLTPTTEEVERVRADLEGRRVARANSE